MQEDDIIRSRRAMHATSPDILLTNYRMLDSLLVRLERKGLWEHNRPETLRFLMVDEFHTFDGAQGTDLTCLIGRDAFARIPGGPARCLGQRHSRGGRGHGVPPKIVSRS